MGPFPHDAPPPAISDENPMGTDGFEFVEYCHPNPEELDRLFKTMGFSRRGAASLEEGDALPAGRHQLRPQRGARILRRERFAAEHGPPRPAMAFRVVDAKHAYERALSLGAKPAETRVGPMELNIPAIEGIGGLQIYLVDRYGAKGSIYDVDFEWLGERDPKPEPASACTTSTTSPTTSIAAA